MRTVFFLNPKTWVSLSGCYHCPSHQSLSHHMQCITRL